MKKLNFAFVVTLIVTLLICSPAVLAQGKGGGRGGGGNRGGGGFRGGGGQRGGGAARGRSSPGRSSRSMSRGSSGRSSRSMSRGSSGRYQGRSASPGRQTANRPAVRSAARGGGYSRSPSSSSQERSVTRSLGRGTRAGSSSLSLSRGSNRNMAAAGIGSSGPSRSFTRGVSRSSPGGDAFSSSARVDRGGPGSFSGQSVTRQGGGRNNVSDVKDASRGGPAESRGIRGSPSNTNGDRPTSQRSEASAGTSTENSASGADGSGRRESVRDGGSDGRRDSTRSGDGYERQTGDYRDQFRRNRLRGDFWAIYLSQRLFGFGYGFPLFGHYDRWGYGGYAPWVYDDPAYYVTDDAIVDEYQEPELLPEPTEQVEIIGERFLVQAETAFREGRYKESVVLIQHTLVELPTDGRVMLFLSQALFAVNDYKGAITAAYRGMSLLEPDDWGFVVTNSAKYYGNNDYKNQMKRLDSHVEANPQAAYAYALRGYHWGYLGYHELAREDLKKALELESQDHFAVKLFAKFGGEAELPEPESTPK